MMRRIKNGEPVFHVHNCSPEREGKVMTAEELHDFAVDVLMLEYKETNCEVIKYNKCALGEADFCFVNTGKIPNFTADNLAGKKVNVLLVYREDINDTALEDLDTKWMVEEYHKTGAIPRVTFFSTLCISENCVNGSPAICGGEFCFQYYSISLIPGEVNEPLEKKLSAVELAAKYVEAWENSDASIIAPYLDKDYHYGSDWVFDEMPSRYEYLSYFQGKLNAVKRGGAQIKIYVGRDHQTGDVAVILLQKGEYSALKIKTNDGRIISGCMKEYDKRFKFFDPADEIFQGHGNHIDCIMPANELVNNRLMSILEKSKWWRNKTTEVTTEDMYENETVVNSLIYGNSDIRILSLVALGKESKNILYMSTYPVTKGKSYDVIVNKVIEWDNQIEATVYCSIGEFEFAFFATDYYCNKELYVSGNKIAVDLSALGLNIEEGQRGFQFEGQQAIDWLARIGEKPTYDKDGNVEPIKFSMENLVAFFNKNSKWPDEAEFQSPTEDLKSLSILDVEFFKTDVKICRRDTDEGELIVSIPLYFRKEFFPTVQEGDPIRGWLWISGSITGEHECSTNKHKLAIMENSYVKKYKEYISFLRANRDELLKNDNWDMLFQVLTRLELSDEYTLDDYRSKKSTNNILRLYARKVSTQRPPEVEFEKYDNIHGIDALFRNFKKLINETEGLEEESDDMPEEFVSLPEKIEPESVVILDFTPDTIWEAYLLRTTDYYIGHRWHGGYHKMTIPANIDELKKFRPWKEYEIPEYEKFIQETEFDFAPKIIINGDVATIEHIAVFFHNRFSQCRATVQYNREARKIESFKFDSTDIFKFSKHFCY